MKLSRMDTVSLTINIPSRLAYEVEKHKPSDTTRAWYTQWLVTDELARIGYPVMARRKARASKRERAVDLSRPYYPTEFKGQSFREVIEATSGKLSMAAYVAALLQDALDRHSRRHHGEI